MFLWKVTIYFSDHDASQEVEHKSRLEQRLAADTPTMAIMNSMQGLNLTMRKRVACISANRMGVLDNAE
jgi:hypothetical protein